MLIATTGANVAAQKCESNLNYPAVCTHYYRNTSCQMVIVRCVGTNAFFHEKVVFPFEELLFACPPHTRVDIWTHGANGAELVDSMPADDLRATDQRVESSSVAPLSLWQSIGLGMAEADMEAFHFTH